MERVGTGRVERGGGEGVWPDWIVGRNWSSGPGCPGRGRGCSRGVRGGGCGEAEGSQGPSRPWGRSKPETPGDPTAPPTEAQPTSLLGRRFPSPHGRGCLWALGAGVTRAGREPAQRGTEGEKDACGPARPRRHVPRQGSAAPATARGSPSTAPAPLGDRDGLLPGSGLRVEKSAEVRTSPTREGRCLPRRLRHRPAAPTRALGPRLRFSALRMQHPRGATRSPKPGVGPTRRRQQQSRARFPNPHSHSSSGSGHPRPAGAGAAPTTGEAAFLPPAVLSGGLAPAPPPPGSPLDCIGRGPGRCSRGQPPARARHTRFLELPRCL
ncbi:uncharacterized protein LOC115831806 [Nomascus leucogenys]|uniref:uncharacterized protein LOC115831806 n=1 Tax=Nomascus leucogenys TaxID=61853 RepID=UPI00122D8D0E|nr:uncharacterized protein LOC115831806 [Nomascus leucogenys]